MVLFSLVCFASYSILCIYLASCQHFLKPCWIRIWVPWYIWCKCYKHLDKAFNPRWQKIKSVPFLSFIHRNRKSNSFSVQSARDWRWRHYKATRPSPSEFRDECWLWTLPRMHKTATNRDTLFVTTELLLFWKLYCNDLLLLPDWLSKIHTYQLRLCVIGCCFIFNFKIGKF